MRQRPNCFPLWSLPALQNALKTVGGKAQRGFIKVKVSQQANSLFIQCRKLDFFFFFFLLSAEALPLCVRHLQPPQTPAFCCWCLQRGCLRCTGTDTWQDVLSSGSRPRCHYNTLAGGDMPSCLVKHAFYRPGSLGVSSYLPAAPDHWLNLRSCVAVSSGLSQQDQNKQVVPILCLCVSVCVRVFLTALLAACVETTTPSWTAAGGGRKSRAAGRTRGGRRAESAVIWDAPSGSGRPWLPSSTFFPHASPPKLNAKIQSKLPFRCALQREREADRRRLSSHGEKFTGVSKVVVVLRWKAAWILVRLVSLGVPDWACSRRGRGGRGRGWRVGCADSHQLSHFHVQHVSSCTWKV